MSMSDPISDMLTRIRNAQQVEKKIVNMPASQLKVSIASVLKEEGYIEGLQVVSAGNKPELKIRLKYHAKNPVIKNIQRVSRPGLRVYKKSRNLPLIMNGLGTAIISTPRGVVTDRIARSYNIGGEVLCYVT